MNNKGFTLVELILFLVLASIVGTALFTYSMSSRYGAGSVAAMKTRLELQAAMETVVFTYKKDMSDGSFDLAEFRNSVVALNLPVTVNTRLEPGMIQAEDPRILKITLSKEGQSIWALFTE